MATLVLTAVGAAVAGPIGGAVGAIVGQQVDRAVLGPRPRQGPRLDDLKVQTSTYGARLPQLFGRMRVAGQVIWSTDLIETRARVSNGKGRGSTDTYSYAASFAVALSMRRVLRVERVWADGKLLRGAAGDMKTDGVMRLHTGDPDQLPDPLIASAEGAGTTPAYRGLAYAMFEALQLADYGNRIPSLSFEVVADEGQVGIGEVLGELAGTAAVEQGPAIDGLAATGDDVRAVAAAFAPAMPMLCRVEDGLPVLRFAPVPNADIAGVALGGRAGDVGGERLAVELAPLDTTAAALTLTHVDASRDYQPGLQRARREGPGLREERVALPATVDAAAARGLAEATLARVGVERMTATATLGWRYLTLRPGDLLRIEGRRWRIAAVAFEAMVVRLSLTRWASVATTEARAVDAGRALTEQDLPPGPTTLALVDLPPTGDGIGTRAQVAVFSAGASAGWRRAAILASIDGGASFTAVGTSALPAVMGTCTMPLPPAWCEVVDRIHRVDVQLLSDAMLLHDADVGALLAGANRAMIGDELIQFGRAEPLGGGRWRLRDLWRGRGGTEDASGGHGTGEAFVLLDPDAALVLPPELAVPGVVVIATGIGDAEPWPEARCARTGRATRPLSPVHLRAQMSDGDVRLEWTRRSRAGWAWNDGVDAPLAEEREAYRIARTVGGVTRTIEVTDTSWRYTAAMRVDDGAASSAVVIAVTQVGAGGVSPPATLTLSAPIEQEGIAA